MGALATTDKLLKETEAESKRLSLEIQLKAEKSKEVATGTAKVTAGDQFIRVTWSR